MDKDSDADFNRTKKLVRKEHRKAFVEKEHIPKAIDRNNRHRVAIKLPRLFIERKLSVRS